MRKFDYSTRKIVVCDEFEYCDAHCHLKLCCDIWIKEKPERVVFT